MASTTLVRQNRRAMPRPRGPTKNYNDPRGQLGRFLRAWIDRHYSGDESQLAKAMGVSDRAVRKWCEGAASPRLTDFGRLADALGYSDWAALAAAVVRFDKR